MTSILRLYKLLTWFILVTILLTPLLAFYNFSNAAGFFYNAYALLCHQYPSRSFAFYPLENKIDDCIKKEGLPVFTIYTKIFAKPYNGGFYFNRNDIGSIRADVCTKYASNNDLIIGYKLPVCARDFGIFLGMAFITFFSRKEENKKENIKEKFPLSYFVLLILPLVIDGTGQLLGFWESTNEIRLLTGVLTGIAISIIFMEAIKY
jgi:uncharacterized membrane protein